MKEKLLELAKEELSYVLAVHKSLGRASDEISRVLNAANANLYGALVNNSDVKGGTTWNLLIPHTLSTLVSLARLSNNLHNRFVASFNGLSKSESFKDILSRFESIDEDGDDSIDIQKLRDYSENYFKLFERAEGG